MPRSTNGPRRTCHVVAWEQPALRQSCVVIWPTLPTLVTAVPILYVMALFARYHKTIHGWLSRCALEYWQKIVDQFVPQESVYHLVERANENGGPDNITAIVVHVQEVGREQPNGHRA